jgi:hypothetical protein
MFDFKLKKFQNTFSKHTTIFLHRFITEPRLRIGGYFFKPCSRYLLCLTFYLNSIHAIQCNLTVDFNDIRNYDDF